MHQPYMSYFRTSQALFSIFIINSLPVLSPNKHYLMKCNRECVLFNMKLIKTEKISHIQVEMSLFCKKLYKKQLRVSPLDTNHSLVLLAFLCHVVLSLKLIQIFK